MCIDRQGDLYLPIIPEFSHCPVSEVLSGPTPRRAKRIRIGHAVALLPGQYRHPVRGVERGVVLDLVSDGRSAGLIVQYSLPLTLLWG
jgi:hypothetical protein